MNSIYADCYGTGKNRAFERAERALILNFEQVPDIYTQSYATVAQLVEQLIRNHQVSGSNPLGGSNKIKGLRLTP